MRSSGETMRSSGEIPIESPETKRIALSKSMPVMAQSFFVGSRENSLRREREKDMEQRAKALPEILEPESESESEEIKPETKKKEKRERKSCSSEYSSECMFEMDEEFSSSVNMRF